MIFEAELIKTFTDIGLDNGLIDEVIDSGYIIRHWVDPFSGKTWKSVSDKLYGNKQTSSNFEIDTFIKYIKKEQVSFDRYPFNTFKVKSFEEIQNILNEPHRKRYIDSGKMSFRGQSKEYYIQRKIPNPIRADSGGKEISILPGAFRNRKLGLEENLPLLKKSIRSFDLVIPFLVPKGSQFDPIYSYDFMRVEQHYATQTQGLDITFDIRSAIYFATHKYNHLDKGKARYTKIEQGTHSGVIYCFVFTDPPVKETSFLIKDFDVFKVNKPERILRQYCGLPLFDEYERNIALTDIDCIIYLDPDFEYNDSLSYEYMFPKESEDAFYRRLLEVKRMDIHPEISKILENVVEYV